MYEFKNIEEKQKLYARKYLLIPWTQTIMSRRLRMGGSRVVGGEAMGKGRYL